MDMFVVDKKTGTEIPIPPEREMIVLNDIDPSMQPGVQMQMPQQMQNLGYGVIGGNPIPTLAGTSEKMLEVMLSNDPSPADLKKLFWSLDAHVALGKATSPEQLRILQLSIENLLRAGYISNRINFDFFDAEQVEFRYSQIEAQRGIVYDGRPNEREMWLMQIIKQVQEFVGEQKVTGTANVFEMIRRAFKGGGGM